MMLNTALAAAGLIGWYLLLLLMIWGSRVYLSVVEGRPANGFANDGSDVGPFSERLCRAHANMYEGAPYLLGPLLLALAIDHSHITEGLLKPVPFGLGFVGRCQALVFVVLACLKNVTTKF